MKKAATAQWLYMSDALEDDIGVIKKPGLKESIDNNNTIVTVLYDYMTNKITVKKIVN